MPSSGLEEAKQLGKQFRADLEYYLKRFSPEGYLPAAAAKITQVLSNRALLPKWPPHFLLHSMEAYCGFHRGHRDGVVDDRVLAKIMSIYTSYVDPLQTYVFEQATPESAELAFIQMQRQQFPVQENYGKYDLARAIRLFLEGDFKSTETALQARCGFGFRDWIAFCAGLYTACLRGKTVVSQRYFLDATFKLVSDGTVPMLFSQISLTVADMQKRYQDVRSKYPSLPHFELHFPVVLYQRPLIDFGEGRYIISAPGLVLSRAADGLYDICRNLYRESEHDEFGDEIGAEFTKYVGKILGGSSLVGVLLSENQLKQHVTGEVCDFLVEIQDCLVLVECKAVGYAQTLITEEAIEKSNAMTKIVEGINQLVNVAHALRDGALTDLVGAVGRRKTVGFVVTYREIFLANGGLYWSKIEPRISLPNGVPQLTELFDWKPQVIDIASLERITQAMSLDMSLESMLRERSEQSIWITGEWNAYLGNKLGEGGPAVPYLEGVFDEFVQSFIPEDE